MLCNSSPSGTSIRAFSLCVGLALLLIAPALPCSAAFLTNEGSWSATTEGLQARLILVERPKLHGARWLVPHLELRNVRDIINSMEVRCDRGRLKIELVDAQSNVVRNGWSSVGRSGPGPKLSTIILPWDSSMRISLECRNWGIPKDAPAMVSTDSGAWVINESERGRVYLRATLTGEKSDGTPPWKRWTGVINTPLLEISWE